MFPAPRSAFLLSMHIQGTVALRVLRGSASPSSLISNIPSISHCQHLLASAYVPGAGLNGMLRIQSQQDLSI